MSLAKENFEGLFVTWHIQADNIFDLFQKKHASYSPDNISTTGLNGVIVRMWDKINRLRRRVLEGEPETLPDETLVDTLRDIANYAIIGLLLLHEIWPEYEP
ncbi:MAG: DUF1599 domain-containing protein [Deltaproteobacteria bacterium]|nr:DUF1599 domain-containing protein [Deltaproteobacteria bacterium]